MGPEMDLSFLDGEEEGEAYENEVSEGKKEEMVGVGERDRQTDEMRGEDLRIENERVGTVKKGKG